MWLSVSGENAPLKHVFELKYTHLHVLITVVIFEHDIPSVTGVLFQNQNLFIKLKVIAKIPGSTSLYIVYK